MIIFHLIHLIINVSLLLLFFYILYLLIKFLKSKTWLSVGVFYGFNFWYYKNIADYIFTTNSNFFYKSIKIFNTKFTNFIWILETI